MKLSGTSQILFVLTVIFLIFCLDHNIVAYAFTLAFAVASAVSYHVDKEWYKFQQAEKQRSIKRNTIVINHDER